MSTHLLLESALRSLIMGVAIYTALRLFRIRQVHARRTAWMLALIASLAMPALVALKIGPRLLPQPSMAPQSERPASTSPFIVLDPTSTPVRHQLSTQPEPAGKPASARTIPYAPLLYLAVAGFLLLRLAIGLIIAARLRRRATPMHAPFDPILDVRVSPRINTPVTIASSILLPESSSQWDEPTLRIVLTHERAHLRQADFYLQLLAAAHAAIFWFNPFSWWLQCELSSLGEAMSDLAAVQQAASRASYAEVLLAFATRNAYPLTSVAMARSSNLKPRIERLLNDRLFHQSAAGKRRLTLAAACVVILAITASTSVRRVQAARANTTGTSTSPNSSVESASSMGSGIFASASLSQTAQDQPSGTALPQQTTAPAPAAPPTPPAPASTTQTHSGTSTSIDIDSDSHSHNNSFSYATSRNGDAFALVTGEAEISFTGTWNNAFQRARANTKGDFIYSRHDGRAYIIQDPAIIAQAKALYAPMQQLSRQQAELGAKQEALGAQQEAFARQIQAVKIPSPDIKKQLAELDAAVQQLKQLEDKPTVDQQTLANLQERMGEIQGRLGELQGHAGEQQGNFGEQQGELGEQQGKLGEQQGKIGERQGDIARDAQRQLKPLIEQAIRDGKAKPVE